MASRVSAFAPTSWRESPASVLATAIRSTPRGAPCGPYRRRLARDGIRALGEPSTDCVLVDERLVSVAFDRAPEPRHDFDRSEVSSERARTLFPLACVLASEDARGPVAPLVTWSTILFPFQGSHGYSQPLLPARLRTAVDVSAWPRAALRNSSSPSSTVRTNVLSSSSRRRKNACCKADDRSPVTRATCDIRTPPPACVEVAVRALRASYSRGDAWLRLTSTKRANVLILEEP